MSIEFCLDLEFGTARNPLDLSPPFDVGDETLCGDVGLLSLLSKDGAARSSGIEIPLAWLGRLAWPGRLVDGFVAAPSSPFGLYGSPCNVEGELGMAPRATASLSISWGEFMLLLTAEVSIVMVGLHE